MFTPGQRVECVDASPSVYGDPSLLTKGTIYTIKSVNSENGRTGVTLYEMPDPSIHYRNGKAYRLGWRAERFRPIQEKSTDISVFTEMLKFDKVLDEEKV